MTESNINYDFEDSDKSLSLEDNPTCIPHLIEKINSLKSEISENNKEIIVDRINILNNKEKSFKKIGVESFDEKTFFI